MTLEERILKVKDSQVGWFDGHELRVIAEDVCKMENRIKRLEEAVYAYRTAYTPDGHVAPHDCFATGPKTGNPYQDLFACPGCWAELKAKEAKLSVNPIQSLGENLMKAGIGFTTEDKL